MINGLIVLIGLQLIGEAIAHFFDVPVPGPVIGMILLLVGLMAFKRVPDDIGASADTLMKYIGLLFVPAGAGVSLYLGLIAEQWVVIAVASFTSTLFTLLLCGWLFKLLSKSDA